MCWTKLPVTPVFFLFFLTALKRDHFDTIGQSLTLCLFRDKYASLETNTHHIGCADYLTSQLQLHFVAYFNEGHS